MRVIVTRNGIEVVEELDEMNRYNPLSSQSIGKKNLTSYNRRNNSLESKSNRYSNTFTSLNDTRKSNKRFSSPDEFDIENLPQNELKQAKELKLTTTKISFPKSFAHNYDDNDTSSNIIDSNFQLPTLSNNFKSIIQSDNNSLLNSKYYSFRDIIPNNKINQMKLNIINEKRLKDRLSRIDETKFRSVYQPKTELEKFDDVLDCPLINPNKMGLIRYLNESKNPQPVTLKDLANSSISRINRMNKMCGILLRKEDQQKVMSQNIQKKIKTGINAEMIEYQKQIDDMKQNINDFKEKMEKYNVKRVDHKENYKDLFHIMETKVWAKYDFERLNKKSTPKLKSEYNINSNISDNKNEENKRNLPEIN
jgi:hypothetical protein